MWGQDITYMDAEDGRFITDGVPGVPHHPAEDRHTNMDIKR